jgi:hypothetical protein
MKLLLILVIALSTFTATDTNASSNETSIRHLDLPDVTSFSEAKVVFEETTSALNSKTVLDAKELQEIHIITYSLEKSIEYFASNLEGEEQGLSEEMAVVVENIHISSENNRREQTEAYLEEYFELADRLESKFES